MASGEEGIAGLTKKNATQSQRFHLTGQHLIFCAGEKKRAKAKAMYGLDKHTILVSARYSLVNVYQAHATCAVLKGDGHVHHTCSPSQMRQLQFRLKKCQNYVPGPSR